MGYRQFSLWLENKTSTMQSQARWYLGRLHLVDKQTCDLYSRWPNSYDVMPATPGKTKMWNELYCFGRKLTILSSCFAVGCLKTNVPRPHSARLAIRSSSRAWRPGLKLRWKSVVDRRWQANELVNTVCTAAITMVSTISATTRYNSI